MIVEDDAAILEVYLIKFEIEGHRVCGAQNGQEALKLLDSFGPDIILLDMMMPIMGGLEFMKQFRAQPRPAEVIVFSNISAPEQRQEALSLGAADYWIKSDFTPELVTRRVMERWQKRGS